MAWTCTLGLWRANMCWIPVGARNPAEENHYVLDAFDCEVLFFQKYFAPVDRRAAAAAAEDQAVDLHRRRAAGLPGALARSRAGSRTSRRRGPNVAVDMDDVVMLSATGGTTGMPKGVMNTHRSAQTFCAHFMIGCPYGADEKPVNLAAAPMTHTAGLLSVPCTARGGTVVVVTKPDPALLLAAIPKYQVTELFLPPTVIYRLLDIPDLGKKVDFSLAQVLHVRRGADVGREAQAGDRGDRPGDDGRLRPDRGAGLDRLPAAGRALRGRQARLGRAPVVGRPSQSADPRRDHERRERDPAARARPARSACAATW